MRARERGWGWTLGKEEGGHWEGGRGTLGKGEGGLWEGGRGDLGRGEGGTHTLKESGFPGSLKLGLDFDKCQPLIPICPYVFPPNI